MEKEKFAILAIDQGTTSSRTLLFDPHGQCLFTAQQEFAQAFPQDGWVEHDPEVIWQSVVQTLRRAYEFGRTQGYQILGVGLTNQRETTLIWERSSGRPVYQAIVWQDRRTQLKCAELESRFGAAALQAKTGLLFDPYFSATKIGWILDHVDGARQAAEVGKLAFGTIDSFLIHRLSGGRAHVTDITNASRTNLYNIHKLCWDEALLELFGIPEALLPRVYACTAHFGDLDRNLLGESLPILGVAGDQQAAVIGQCCFKAGDLKSTYGTGCFALMNTGADCLTSKNRLLSTIAYQIKDQMCYGLEGSIFIAGAAVQWLRDGVQIIEDAAHSEKLAAAQPGHNGHYLVPAFTGLGAPYWRPEVRGALFGLTRTTSRADIVRATLESLAYQTDDLLRAMTEDGIKVQSLRVDGGVVKNDWLMQFLADILDLDVARPYCMETTALGASWLVCIQAGLYSDVQNITPYWKCETVFRPQMKPSHRADLMAGWHQAVSRVLL